MTYRLLPREEWPKLHQVFVQQGSRLPADGARIAVAEQDGTICGFLVLQFVPHAEPLWIAEEQRGAVYWPHLLHLLEQELHGGEYYVFAPDPHMAGFAVAADCELMPWVVYRKVVA